MAKSHINLSVRQKLFIGFGLIIVVAVVVFNLIDRYQSDSNQRIVRNVEVYYPSLVYTENLRDLITVSQNLTQKWVLEADARDIRLRNSIETYHGAKYDTLRSKIVYFVDKDLWSDQAKDLYFRVTSITDTLFNYQENLLENLSDAGKFSDLLNLEYQRSNIVSGEFSDCYNHARNLATELTNIYYTEAEANLNEVHQNFINIRKVLKYAILAVILIVILVGFILSYTLIGSFVYLKGVIQKVSEGLLPEIKIKDRSDEVGQMAQALRMLINNLSETSQFALKIGEGDFQSEFKPQSKNDVLGNSLLVMRDNLIKADQEAEKRNIENFQRNWSSKGLAEFNELLRNCGDDMEKLSYSVIERLVRYLDANMGGMYIVAGEGDNEKEDRHLELTAFYAYDRLKYQKRRIEIGENLVGQCFQENQTVYLTDLPKGYVHISSGLGDSDPNCLVIVPLKLNDVTYGIVELASFKIIEPYQVEFIEKIGETIASTIASVKINMETNKLLADSNEKTERLAIQEAQAQRQIEEKDKRIATLEEQSKRDQAKYQKLHDDYDIQAENYQTLIFGLNGTSEKLKDDNDRMEFAINNSIGYYELDGQGFFSKVNSRFLNDVDMLKDDIVEKDIRSFMVDDQDKEDFELSMKKFADGSIITKETHYKFNQKDYYLQETFTPIRDAYSVVLKVMVFSQNKTVDYHRQNDLAQQIENMKIEIDILKGRV